MANKMRSPNYPALSLPQALEATGRLWNSEKRTAVSHQAAALAMGFTTLSGSARVTIGALRQYGLIEKAEKGHIQISELAVAILHGQGTEREIALGQAGLMPALFSDLYRTHADASETAIRSHLITKKQFSEDGARKAAKAFRDTIAFAMAPKKGYTSVDGQEKPENMNGIDQGQNLGDGGSVGGGKRQDVAGVMSFNVPFAKGTLMVQVRITGDTLKQTHIARIVKYLELAKDDLEDGDS